MGLIHILMALVLSVPTVLAQERDILPSELNQIEPMVALLLILLVVSKIVYDSMQKKKKK